MHDLRDTLLIVLGQSGADVSLESVGYVNSLSLAKVGLLSTFWWSEERKWISEKHAETLIYGQDEECNETRGDCGKCLVKSDSL